MKFSKKFTEKQKEAYKEAQKKSYEETINNMLKKTANLTETPEKMLEYLVFLSKFYDYSPRNRALIHSQREGAIAVGSFTYFKEQGYSVLKGEKAIKIIVPKKVQFFERKENGKTKIVKLSEATKQEKEKIKSGKIKTRSKTFYNLGSVFDITQTNVPKNKYPTLYPNRHEDFTLKDPSNEKYSKVLTSFDSDKRIKNLETSINNLLNDIDIKITRTLPESDLNTYGNAHGFYDQEKNYIYLNPKNTPTENIKTSIHEIAHSLLHGKDTPKKRSFLEKSTNLSKYFNKDISTEIKELQAEMVAYTVCKQYGIDTQEHSARYIASWTNNNKKFNELEPKEQQDILQNISGVATTLDNHLLTSLKQIASKEMIQEQDKKVPKKLEKVKIKAVKKDKNINEQIEDELKKRKTIKSPARTKNTRSR